MAAQHYLQGNKNTVSIPSRRIIEWSGAGGGVYSDPLQYEAAVSTVDCRRTLGLLDRPEVETHSANDTQEEKMENGVAHAREEVC